MAIQHRNRSRNIGFGEPLATGTRRSLGKHTLALPCVALALAVVLCIFNTLQGLPQSSSGFVGVSSNVMSLSSERVRSNVARKNSMDDQVAYMKERQSRRLSRTPRNRGSDEYKALGAESRAEKEAEWNVFNSRGTENVVGSDGWMPKVTAPPTEEKSSGPAIELPSFSLPEVSLPSFPAPAPAPAPSRVAQSGGGDAGGNPFSFLVELFQGTTTTTTTTPPPSPLESFLSGLGLR